MWTCLDLLPVFGWSPNYEQNKFDLLFVFCRTVGPIGTNMASVMREVGLSCLHWLALYHLVSHRCHRFPTRLWGLWMLLLFAASGPPPRVPPSEVMHVLLARLSVPWPQLLSVCWRSPHSCLWFRPWLTCKASCLSLEATVQVACLQWNSPSSSPHCSSYVVSPLTFLSYETFFLIL